MRRGSPACGARLYAPDAAVLKQRVEEMARGVCDEDPRTLGERRSDALTAMAAGIHELACECGNTDCPAAHRDATPPATAVIHVVADAATVEAGRTEATGGTPPPDPAPAAAADLADPAPATASDVDAKPVTPAPVAESAGVPPAFAPAPATERAGAQPAFCPAPPAFVIGSGVLPAPLLATTVERATVREIRHPGDAPPEPHYRLS
jgi:Domain of unknown function (DUF222)